MIATPSLLDKLDLTLYVRSPEKAQRLTSELGLKTAVGTLADLDKLEQLYDNLAQHNKVSNTSTYVSTINLTTPQ